MIKRGVWRVMKSRDVDENQKSSANGFSTLNKMEHIMPDW